MDTPVDASTPQAETVTLENTPDVSLNDHAAEFPAPKRTIPSAAPVHDDGSRDESGRFKPQKRAVTQRAGADDVNEINALTKDYHDNLTGLDLGVTQKDGESNRVFELRKRAALAKAYKEAKSSAAAPSTRQSSPAVQVRAQPSVPNGADSGHLELPADFPKPPTERDFPDVFELLKATARWETKAEMKREQMARDRQGAIERRHTGLQTKFEEARKTYQDFDSTIGVPQSPIPQGSLIDEWVWEHPKGAHIAYHFFKHPDEIGGILQLPPLQQVEALSLLTQRLTAQQTDEPRPQAALPTRSAAAPIDKPAPPPPNLVRSGPTRGGDEPPADGASLASHESYYYGSKRKPVRR